VSNSFTLGRLSFLEIQNDWSSPQLDRLYTLTVPSISEKQVECKRRCKMTGWDRVPFMLLDLSELSDRYPSAGAADKARMMGSSLFS
jgi:hypothetical protein